MISDLSGKVLSLLGIAMKAGKVRSGAYAAEESLRSGVARLAVLDCDSSEESKKHWSDLCGKAGVPLLTARDVGSAIGKDGHMIACVTDEGFASAIMRGRNESVM